MSKDSDVYKAHRDLAENNTPENQERFKHAFRNAAKAELDHIKREQHDTYREFAQDANSPQVDIESFEDFDQYLAEE